FREHDEKLLRAQYAVNDDEAALIQTSQDARRELQQLFAADRGEGVLGGIVAPKDPEGGSRRARRQRGIDPPVLPRAYPAATPTKPPITAISRGPRLRLSRRSALQPPRTSPRATR